MRIKALLRIIKRYEQAQLICPEPGNGAEQWLAVGSGLYCLTGMPMLTADILLTLMDIPAERRGSFDIQTACELPLDVEAYAIWKTEGEVDTAPLRMTVTYMGVEFIPFSTDGGAIFINREMLAPFSEDAAFSIRRTPTGQAYLFVREGTFAAGVVMPRQVGRDPELPEVPGFVDKLMELAAAAEAELGNSEEERV